MLPLGYNLFRGNDFVFFSITVVHQIEKGDDA